MMVWRRMNSHSSSSAARACPRIVSGIATLPMSWSSAACRLSRSVLWAIQLAGDGLRQYAHFLRWSPSSGWR